MAFDHAVRWATNTAAATVASHKRSFLMCCFVTHRRLVPLQRSQSPFTIIDAEATLSLGTIIGRHSLHRLIATATLGPVRH